MPHLISIGIENNVEGRSLAWALDYPGCFAYGKDEGEALLRLPAALVKYEERIQARAAQPWLALGDFDLRLLEVVNDLPGGQPVAWFEDDARPLSQIELERGLEMLRWSRADLLELAAAIPPQQMERAMDGEARTLGGILRHVADAEWWYLDRLGLAPVRYAALPPEPLERLAATRAMLAQALPALVDRPLALEKKGETWSPRKLLRRALQHELDHIGEISFLLLANG